MKKLLKRFLYVVLFLVVGFIAWHIYFVNSMMAVESYPVDTFLAEEENKVAAIIVAHDDDNAILVGTTAKLVKEGWKVYQFSFRDEDEPRNERLVQASKTVCSAVEFIEIGSDIYRNDLDTNQRAYLPIALADFDKVFNPDTVLQEIDRKIREYKPSVIFSLDDSIGGYGHPDHVFLSQLTRIYCQARKGQDGFSVKRIYQSVYPPSMEQAILVDHMNMWNTFNIFEHASEVYESKGGMPLPDVEVNIYEASEEKMAYYRGLGGHEQRNVRKFVPYFDRYPHWLYFYMFDREFFRVIDLTE